MTTVQQISRWTRLAALVAGLGLCLSTSAAAGPPDLGLDEGATPGRDAVRARLVSSASSVAPGETFWLGVHLHQDEGWHTYWRNGGDSGLPTEVKWDLPEGWQVGELRWPTPHRYVEAGDLVTYGYVGDVVLMAPVTVPDDAEAGRKRLGASVSWLMCKDLCVPGSAEIASTVAVGDSEPNASERDQKLMAAARSRWPQPAQSDPSLQVEPVLDMNAVPAGQLAHAAIRVSGADAEGDWTWFPYEQEFLVPQPEAVTSVDGQTYLHFAFQADPSAPAGQSLDWGGVLEIDSPSGARFVKVGLEVPVAGPGQAIQPTHKQLFAELLGGGGLFDQDYSGTTPSGRSLLYYLFLALIGGILLNVMPCVLPVLSLKVMSFVRHANEDRGVQLRLGLTFALGVLASFLALALVVIGLQRAGAELGWGFQFQNPVFVVVMSAVVFTFALSLFGVFEIVLPMNLGAGGGRAGAYAESFLNGILATALATPCTAPILGTALGFAFTQSAASILAIFLAIGVGLSLPYVLLSANPAWLRFVPKPGAWMDRFKQAMGFLLMATLVWLLWVLGQQVGTSGVVATLAFLTTLGAALWIYGAFLSLSASSARKAVVWILMLVLVGGGWWQFLRGSFTSEALAETRSVAAADHGRWKPFSVAELEAQVGAGNTVMLDFTAAWCTTCKVNEATVLHTDAIESKLEELGVVTMLGDWTHRDEEITKVLRKFGRSGVPFYAVFPAHRLDAPIVLPELITSQLVLDALDEAGPSRPLSSR